MLDEQKQALQALVRETGTVFGALTEREDQLRTLITAQDDVFTAIANERENWAETFRIFPTFLDESKAHLRRAWSRFSAKAEPVLRDLAPAMRDLGPTLDAVGDFGPDLKRFFVNFDPLITISKRSLPATTEVLRGLTPLLAELGPFLTQVNPILQYIGVHVYTLSDMFANLGVATQAKVADPGPLGGTGHYLRQFGPVGPEGIAIQPTRSSGNRGNAYFNPLGVLSSPEGQSSRSCRASTATTPARRSPAASPRRPAAGSRSRSSSRARRRRATRSCATSRTRRDGRARHALAPPRPVRIAARRASS